MRQALLLLFGFAGSMALAEPPSVGFGGGYRAAKWGASPEQVRAALAAKPGVPERAPDGDVSLGFELAAGRRLTCWFFDEQLYSVVYDPHLANDDRQGAEAVLLALQKKYGKGEVLPSFVDPRGEPLLVVAWDDGETEIQYQMLDPAKRRAGKKVPSSSVKVSYRSKRLAEKRDAWLRQAGSASELEKKVQAFEEEI